MSEKLFGVYGKIVGASSPLLTEKECLEISKCRDKTQLVVEIYEAVRRVVREYEDSLLDHKSNDSLHFELYRLTSAVVAYCRGFLHQDVSDAVAVAQGLYSLHIASKTRGFDISRIINNARISRDEEQTSQKKTEGVRESQKS